MDSRPTWPAANDPGAESGDFACSARGLCPQDCWESSGACEGAAAVLQDNCSGLSSLPLSRQQPASMISIASSAFHPICQTTSRQEANTYSMIPMRLWLNTKHRLDLEE